MSDPSPFSIASIAQSVHASMDDALKVIPPGHSGAFFIGAKTDPHDLGFKATAAQKFGEDWMFYIGGQWTTHHGYGAEVGLMGSWGSHRESRPLAAPSMSAGS